MFGLLSTNAKTIVTVTGVRAVRLMQGFRVQGCIFLNDYDVGSDVTILTNATIIEVIDKVYLNDKVWSFVKLKSMGDLLYL